MKKYIAITVLSLFATLASAQTYVGLSDKSTIPATTITENVQKFCKGNVVITNNEDKAEYMLVANFTGYGFEGNAIQSAIYEATHAPDAGAAIALVYKGGDVVYSKSTREIHNAFKDMCKDYFGKKKR